jgi:hypothetical protein
MNWIKKIFSTQAKPPKAPLGCVELTEDIITYHHPDGELQKVVLSNLTEVGILTTDEGPFVEDVFFMLIGESTERGCAIPQGATGVNTLLERLQSLQGFDNEKLIEAMGSTSNNKFVVWKK